MDPINNSVSVSGFSVRMNEFPALESQEEVPPDYHLDEVFDPAGVHFSVGDGTQKSALDSVLIHSFEKISKLMLDYLPETRFTPLMTGVANIVKDIDEQEGLSAFLLRELVSNKIVPIALTSGMVYGTSKLVQNFVLDPLGLVKDEGFAGSGLNMAQKWVLGKVFGAGMPEDLHGSLLNDFSRSLICLVVNNSLVPGEAIKSFSGKLMDGWTKEEVECVHSSTFPIVL